MDPEVSEGSKEATPATTPELVPKVIPKIVCRSTQTGTTVPENLVAAPGVAAPGVAALDEEIPKSTIPGTTPGTPPDYYNPTSGLDGSSYSTAYYPGSQALNIWFERGRMT